MEDGKPPWRPEEDGSRITPDSRTIFSVSEVEANITSIKDNTKECFISLTFLV